MVLCVRLMRVLVVEDDHETAAYLVKGLSDSGHRVSLAEDGHKGLECATHETFDALIIDRMLPGMDGLTIVASLRAARNQTPVLVLSALGDVSARVKGLRAGCDDYIAKPFALAELLARLEALTRRGTAETRLIVGDLEMDLINRTVSRSGRSLDLLPREFRLLEYLMRHAGDVVTRTMLLEKVWNQHFDPQTNVVDVHVSRLRQKLNNRFDVPLVETVRGVGYRLRMPE
jgi:two-component system OmpR family response regulator